jgi:hypothetical protein
MRAPLWSGGSKVGDPSKFGRSHKSNSRGDPLSTPTGVAGDSFMATWALKRKPVGNHPYSTLSTGWSREARAPHRLWLCFAVVVGVLGAVSLSSVRTGPSAGQAIVAIRVAQQELLREKPVLRDSALRETEALLSLAWATLKERRYEESIVAARNAYQRVRAELPGSLL